MPVMTIRLSRHESARVATLAKKKKVTRSELVRQALAVLERSEPANALDGLEDLVGTVKEGPVDLATGARHMKGFGKQKRR